MTFPVVNGLRGIEFGTKGEFRDELIALILDGKKERRPELWNGTFELMAKTLNM